MRIFFPTIINRKLTVQRQTMAFSIGYSYYMRTVSCGLNVEKTIMTFLVRELMCGTLLPLQNAYINSFNRN